MAQTLRTLPLELDAAGLRTSEALHLTMRDVDLATTVLTVRNTKFYKSCLSSRRRPSLPVPCGLMPSDARTVQCRKGSS